MDALRDHFRPEFLNRVDEIIFFHALDRSHLAKIVDVQMAGLIKRLEERKIHVRLTDAREACWPARATTRPTGRGRSSARSSAACWTRWRFACSKGGSSRATR